LANSRRFANYGSGRCLMSNGFAAITVRRLRLVRFFGMLVFVCPGLSVSGCKKHDSASSESASSEQAPPGSLELVFSYGSEKEKRIGDVTRDFNQRNIKTSGGRAIFVRALSMGSGETIDNILSGRLQAHIASPASGASESNSSGCYALPDYPRRCRSFRSRICSRSVPSYRYANTVSRIGIGRQWKATSG